MDNGRGNTHENSFCEGCDTIWNTLLAGCWHIQQCFLLCTVLGSCLHPTEAVQQCSSLRRVETNMHRGKHGHTPFAMNGCICFPIKINKQANILGILFLFFFAWFLYFVNLFMVSIRFVLFVWIWQSSQVTSIRVCLFIYEYQDLFH
jgi:hypothetical protein